MFYPTVSHRSEPLGTEARVEIYDHLLTDPAGLVELAQQHRLAFLQAQTNAFPGLELPLPPAALAPWRDWFSSTAKQHFGVRRVVDIQGRLSMVTAQPDQLVPVQRICHRDRLETEPGELAIAGVLYLFEQEALGGTNFFTAREPERINERIARWAQMNAAAFEADTGWPPRYMLASNQHFEHLLTVAPRFNRLLLYRGDVFHGSAIGAPHLLCDQPTQGRLTLNLFMRCKRSAA
jgi:Family of unknown function (DUF6445)